ncbi:ribosomal-processing cysteine protease Prp [Oceanobacillus sp. CAU 1775]
MIRVTVKRKDNFIQSIELSGHAESGPYGYDLVCAGVSAVSIGTVNAVMELSEVNLEIEQGGEGGYLKVAFPKMHDDKESEKAQLLFEGMLVSLKSIENEYGKFIRIIES